MEKNAIEVQNLIKSFGKLKVLEGINFSVKQGTVVALLGPNGAGKTTTIKILSTLIPLDGGEARVAGFDVARQADEVRGVIGLTGQYSAVDEYLTGRENLEMMGQLYHLSKKDSQDRAQSLLEQFDLLDAASRPAKNYSGGMMRRLDLAASLIATPPVLFLDEPTTGLDPRSRQVVWQIIKQLVKSGITILLTTQNLEEADVLADHIILIDHGKVIAEGTAKKLKAGVGNERIEFTLANQSDFNRARKLIDSRSAQFDIEKRVINLATEGGVRDVRQTLKIFEDEGVEIESMALKQPTLDDVFLQLTGRETEKEGENGKR